MDEVLRTVREGVRGDGKTFTGGGRRPNLTFVNLPGVDSSGHGTGRGAVYDATVGPGRRADPALRGSSRRQLRPLGPQRARAALRPLDGDDAEQELADRALHGARGSRRATTRSCRTARRRSSTSTTRGRPGASRCSSGCARRRSGASVAPLAGPPAAEALVPRAEPGRRREREHAGGAAPGVAVVGERPRIGDLVVTAVAPDGAFNEPNPLTGNHGGPQTRDNFFAVIGGGPLVRRQALAGAVDPLFDDTERNPGQAENVDVARDGHAAARRARAGPERGALPGRGVRALAAAAAGRRRVRPRRAQRPRASLRVGEAARARAAARVLPRKRARAASTSSSPRSGAASSATAGWRASRAGEGVHLARARRA